MAIGYINTGTIANDGTGDDLREAFTKITRFKNYRRNGYTKQW